MLLFGKKKITVTVLSVFKVANVPRVAGGSPGVTTSSRMQRSVSLEETAASEGGFYGITSLQSSFPSPNSSGAAPKYPGFSIPGVGTTLFVSMQTCLDMSFCESLL